MIEKPNIFDEKIISSLRDGFEIEVTDIKFLPLGNNSSKQDSKIPCAKTVILS